MFQKSSTSASTARDEDSTRHRGKLSMSKKHVEETCRGKVRVRDRGEVRAGRYLQAKIRQFLSRSIKTKEDVHTLDIILVYLVYLI